MRKHELEIKIFDFKIMSSHEIKIHQKMYDAMTKFQQKNYADKGFFQKTIQKSENKRKEKERREVKQKISYS